MNRLLVELMLINSIIFSVNGQQYSSSDSPIIDIQLNETTNQTEVEIDNQTISTIDITDQIITDPSNDSSQTIVNELQTSGLINTSDSNEVIVANWTPPTIHTFKPPTYPRFPENEWSNYIFVFIFLLGVVILTVAGTYIIDDIVKHDKAHKDLPQAKTPKRPRRIRYRKTVRTPDEDSEQSVQTLSDLPDNDIKSPNRQPTVRSILPK